MAEMIWNAAVSVYKFIMDNIVLINIFLGRRRRFIRNGFAWRIRRCQGLKI